MIYLKDHLPPHVHCVGGGLTVKIKIKTLDIISGNGAHPRDVKKLRLAIKRERQNLLDFWEIVNESEKK